jgi:preprotein translocase subunit SecA
MVRADRQDLIYMTEEAKFKAVVTDIEGRHAEGQPVLIGTVSVEKSEYLSQQLRKQGIPHEVLNAKYHEREAQIIAQAGRKGAVTVATNMAGRGTDIMLGGNAEALATAELAQRGLTETDNPDEFKAAWAEALEKAKKAVSIEQDEVREAGGLYVLGTERHESRRIDNQLRGRAGRQGDPGESRFYLSLGDDLMRLFKAQIVERVLAAANVADDVPIESKMVTRAIQSAQSQLEQQNFEIRKNVLKYDDVINKQRTVIYAERLRVLEGEDLREHVRHMMEDTVRSYVEAATSDGFAEDWDLEKLWTALRTLYPISITLDEVDEAVGGKSGITAQVLTEELTADILSAYDRREAQLSEAITRELERRVVLSVLDRKWREHLYEMDYLQEGIGLRAMAQRDPLVEYQREGFDMFNVMMDAIKEESVGYLFNLEVQVEATSDDPEAQARADAATAQLNAKGLEAPKQPAKLNYSAPSETGDAEERTVVNDAVPQDAKPEPKQARNQGRRRKK